MKKIKKQEEQIGMLSLIVLVLSIGMFLGASVSTILIKRFPGNSIPKAEVQLQAYKKAELVCGVTNVQEKPFIRGKGDNTKIISTPEFLCTDMKFAALSEASRSAVVKENLQKNVDNYCDKKEKGYYTGDFILY